MFWPQSLLSNYTEQKMRLIETDLEGSARSEFQRTVSTSLENEEENVLVKLAAISMSNKFPALLI